MFLYVLRMEWICYVNMIYITDYIELQNVKKTLLITEKSTIRTEAQSDQLFVNSCHFKCLHFIAIPFARFRTWNIPYLIRFHKLQVVPRMTGMGTSVLIRIVHQCTLTSLTLSRGSVNSSP